MGARPKQSYRQRERGHEAQNLNQKGEQGEDQPQKFSQSIPVRTPNSYKVLKNDDNDESRASSIRYPYQVFCANIHVCVVSSF